MQKRVHTFTQYDCTINPVELIIISIALLSCTDSDGDNTFY